jgi:uncharacterized protein
VRITPDTGILVRTNTKATGPARRLLETILTGPHELVLSEFLLEETARVLQYPRIQKIYQLTSEDIAEHIQLLRDRADLVSSMVQEPVIWRDPDDDPVLYTAVDGRADVLCALDRDFYAPEVLAFCQQRGIEVMNDVALLQRLRKE